MDELKSYNYCSSSLSLHPTPPPPRQLSIVGQTIAQTEAIMSFIPSLKFETDITVRRYSCLCLREHARACAYTRTHARMHARTHQSVGVADTTYLVRQCLGTYGRISRQTDKRTDGQTDGGMNDGQYLLSTVI